MELHLGHLVQHHDFSRYRKAGFDLRELRAEPGRLPRLPKLKEQLAQATSIIGSVVFPATCFEVGENGRASLNFAMSVATDLQPRWVVLQTGSGFRPGASSRRQLAELVERVRPLARLLAWEPSGLWQAAQASAVASTLGIHCVLAPSAFLELQVPERVAYLRWRMLGNAARVNEFDVEAVVAKALGLEEVFVMIEGDRARQLASSIRQTVRAFEDELGDPEAGDGSDPPDLEDEG